MESFRTILPLAKAPFGLTHDDRLLLVGSCFTEHLGERLLRAKFYALSNPNGILYNPVSIGRCIDGLLQRAPYRSADLFFLNELWHSWEHHGHFSSPDAEETMGKIRSAQECASDMLDGERVCLMVTLGTAQVHLLAETGRVVANNHKAPAAWFRQERLSVQQVVDALSPALASFGRQQPEHRVVLTVSPVRHLHQGMVENQRSKAVLVLACEALEKQFDNAWYFPAYELLLDDLRDYRFYAGDYLHPSEAAVQYIWDYFCRAFFDEATLALTRRLEKLWSAAQHRPFYPDTQAHRSFCAAQLAEIADIRREHPRLDFEKEQQFFENFLNA